MKKNILLFLAVLLLGVTIFSFYKYTQMLMIKHKLEVNLITSRQEANDLRDKANTLQGEAQRERQKREAIEAELNATEEKLKELNVKLSEVPSEITRLNNEINSLKNDNLSLDKEKEELVSKLNVISREKQALELKLGSLEELKKAIADLKTKLFANKVDMQKSIDARRLAEGNKGYLVKGGKPTGQPKVKIEVFPAP